MVDWKLIDESREAGYDNSPQSGSSGQLYNLAEDPGEKENLYETKPDIVTRMKSKLEQVKEGDYREM